MDTYLKGDVVYEEYPVDLEEYEYHWALSDISGFVVKYGLERVLKDIQDYIVSQERYE
jgi:hypothetical protein